MEIASKLSQTYFFQGINSYKFQTSKYNLKKKTYHIFPSFSIIFHPPKKYLTQVPTGSRRPDLRVEFWCFRRGKTVKVRLDSTEALAYVHSKGRVRGFEYFESIPRMGETTLQLGNEKTKVGFFRVVVVSISFYPGEMIQSDDFFLVWVETMN